MRRKRNLFITDVLLEKKRERKKMLGVGRNFVWARGNASPGRELDPSANWNRSVGILVLVL